MSKRPWWQFQTWGMTVAWWALVVASIVVLVLTFPPFDIFPYEP